MDVYRSGSYFDDPSRHADDARFKVDAAWPLLARSLSSERRSISKYADIGCGSGVATRLLRDQLRAAGHPADQVVGYDVSPHVASMEDGDIEFRHADFSTQDVHFDLVSLFDVFEHIPATIGFLQAVAARCDRAIFHVPLEASAYYSLTDVYRERLRDPGHLLYLDLPGALNVIALGGFTVDDYEFTFLKKQAVPETDLKSRLLRFARLILWRVSPALLVKTLGGASVMVLARSAAEQHPRA